MFLKGIISHIFGLDMLAGRVNETIVSKETMQKKLILKICAAVFVLILIKSKVTLLLANSVNLKYFRIFALY